MRRREKEAVQMCVRWQLGVQGRAAWGFSVCHSICVGGTNADPWLLCVPQSENSQCTQKSRLAGHHQIDFTRVSSPYVVLPSDQIPRITNVRQTVNIMATNYSKIQKRGLRMTSTFLDIPCRMEVFTIIYCRPPSRCISSYQEASFNVAFSSQGNEENTVDSTFSNA